MPPTNGKDEDVGEGSDAWEAAQNILRAINCGSLVQMGKDEQKRVAGGNINPSPVLASANMNVNLTGRSTQTAETSSHPRVVVVTPEDRASLQAQLALLAAQMAELAEGGDGPAIGDPNAIDPIAFKADALGDRDGEGEVDKNGDEEEDMEIVDIPTAAPAAVLGT